MRAEDIDAGDSAQAIDQVLGEICFVLADAVDTAVEHIFDAGGEAGETGVVGGAGLVFVGEEVWLVLVLGAAAGTAGDEWRKLIHVEMGMDGETAGAGGAEEAFVAGEGEEIDLLVFDVDWPAAGGLGGIDEEGNVVCASAVGDGGEIEDGAADIGRVIDDDETRAGADGIFDFLRVDRAVGLGVGDGQPDAGAFEGAQGAHDGVVFHAGGDDVVARAEQAAEDEIKAGSGVGHEQDAEWIAEAKQFCDVLAGGETYAFGFVGEAVAAAAGVGADVAQEAEHGVGDAVGLGPACRGVVEVDESGGCGIHLRSVSLKTSDCSSKLACQPSFSAAREQLCTWVIVSMRTVSSPASMAWRARRVRRTGWGQESPRASISSGIVLISLRPVSRGR